MRQGKSLERWIFPRIFRALGKICAVPDGLAKAHLAAR
jgi:hypothetical protein